MQKTEKRYRIKEYRERISLLEKELLAEQVLHNSAKKLNFTLSEIIKDQDAVVAALREQTGKVKESTDSTQLRKLYYELLYAVINAFPNESRHETALRYIRERERPTNQAQAASAPPQEQGE